ncbi:hypothetical protein F5888DRAFT_1612373 [Russula emetica]|nr:hypothetical protein F5888DRAFT_1612373 [Russula emetica]
MTTTFALDCPICLEKLHDPVATPCGHLGCEACIKAHARGSSDTYEATCPTCRAPFPIVTPDMSIVPKKYQTFISPPLRRVFLDAREDNSRVVIENLNAEISTLKERVTSLKRDKVLLIDRCDSAQSALTRLRADERTARLASRKAKADALENKEKLNRLRAQYDGLKSQ